MVPVLMMIRPAQILAGMLLVSLASTAGVWLHGRAELAEARQSYTVFVAQVERNAREASQTARVEEQRRKGVQLEIVQLARQSAQRAAEDLAHRVALSERLREHASQLASGCASSGDPAVADGGEATPAAGAVLADMLSRIEQAAGELAVFADAAVNAGIACERSYVSLSESEGER